MRLLERVASLSLPQYKKLHFQHCYHNGRTDSQTVSLTYHNALVQWKDESVANLVSDIYNESLMRV